MSLVVIPSAACSATRVSWAVRDSSVCARRPRGFAPVAASSSAARRTQAVRSIAVKASRAVSSCARARTR